MVFLQFTRRIDIAIRHLRQLAGLRVAPTFAEFGAIVLAQREQDGIRGIIAERYRFRLHLERSAIGSMPLDRVATADIADLWRSISAKEAADRRAPRRLSGQTVDRCMGLVSTIFEEAVTAGHIEENPCKGFRPKRKAAGATQTEDKWAYLTLDEQRAISTCEAIPEAERLIIMFAVYTGLRQGEQWNLELRDLHTEDERPHVFVRFGSRGKLPKSGKTRRVPLIGSGLSTARRWREVLPEYAPENPEGLAFPSRRGRRRQCGKFGTYDGLRRTIARAGVTRHVRWHDLRHTTASSLISGIWGRRWSMNEVREMLGHSSVLITQRYAHLGESELEAAARETTGVSE